MTARVDSPQCHGTLPFSPVRCMLAPLILLHHSCCTCCTTPPQAMRVVVRVDFTVEGAESLATDLLAALAWCDAHFKVYSPGQLDELEASQLGPGRKLPISPNQTGKC